MEIDFLPGQTENETLRLAKSELQGYLRRMGNPDIVYTLGEMDLTAFDMPAVTDPGLDDQYLFDVDGSIGHILGVNARSVLLAVYRYLTLLGCAFPRPGKRYEVVPVKSGSADFAAHEKRTAALRHRGVCIEGSESVGSILDFIDWLPKIGFNSYFSQFDTPDVFLWRFYTDSPNPLRKKVPWTIEQSRRVMDAADAELTARGLIQHRVGHGWTGKVLGSAATGWARDEKKFDEKTRAMMAEVNGKRELRGGVPANTNLCMTNPDAIEAFSDSVLAYARENPSVDYLHIWLADDCNNHCECPACRKERPSDRYVRLLNRIDEKLTREGIGMKLVMLLYVDLLWAPESVRLNNPCRFVLMFAPITRSFETSFDEVTVSPSAPVFRLNRLSFPSDLGMNLRFLKDWQAAAKGCDCFDYDYYLGRSEYGDPTLINPARIMNRDVKKHEELGLNGIISCQNLRNHLPNGLSDWVLAESLFDPSQSYEELAERYCIGAYGNEGGKVQKLLEELSGCFKQNFLFYAVPEKDEEYAEMLSRVPSLSRKLAETCEEHVPCEHEAQERMWEELRFFAEYVRVYASFLKLRAEGKKDEALRVFETEFRPLVHRYELKDEGALDPWRLEVCVYLHLK